jgi:tRNA threonylcarbamoyl adenosine modification protein YeaZ
MRILAIDTSRGAASVAVFDGSSQSTLARDSVAMARGHAEALAPMLERAMRDVEGGFASIERVAVAIGPGSFTGIRVGLAMARAIALTLEAPVVGVSTLVAFIGPLLEQPGPGVIASVIDARHGQVYFQLFESIGRPILPPRVTSVRDAARLIGGGPARLAGDAAMLVAEEARRGGVEFDASEAAAFPDIVALARIGLAADPEASPARPLYVKAPDAHPSQGDAIARVEG